MEKRYTESELRQRLFDKGAQFAHDLTGRLRDDNFFKIHTLSLSGKLWLDGEPVSDWTPFKRLFGGLIDNLVRELLSEILVVLFEDDSI